MRGRGIVAVVQECFEIRAIMIEFTRLRYGRAVESDVTLAEQRMQEMFSDVRKVCGVQVLPNPRD